MKSQVVFESLNNNPKALLIDVREPSEYAGGHAQSATSHPLSQFPDNFTSSHSDKNAVIFVICASGGRSQVAVNLLASQGYTQVQNVDGGTSEWMKQKLPIERPSS